MHNGALVRVPTFLLALLLAFGVAVSGASAQDKAKKPATLDNPVIAVVDVVSVFGKAKAAQNIRDQVEAERNKYDAMLTNERKALDKEQEALRKQQNILSQDSFEKRRQELERKYGDLKRQIDSYKRTLYSGRANAERRLDFEMKKLLAGLMKDRGINITLRRTQVIPAIGSALP